MWTFECNGRHIGSYWAQLMRSHTGGPIKVQNLANRLRCTGTFMRLHGDRANSRSMEIWTLKRNVSDQLSCIPERTYFNGGIHVQLSVRPWQKIMQASKKWLHFHKNNGKDSSTLWGGKKHYRNVLARARKLAGIKWDMLLHLNWEKQDLVI